MTRPPSHTLSIDWGTSHLKVALFGADLTRLSEGAVAVPWQAGEPGRAEMDAEDAWQAVTSAIGQVSGQAGATLSQVATVALTSQAQTFTIIDEQGEPLLPFLGWADMRAIEESEELVELLGADFHRHCSYPRPKPGMQLCKLLWLKRHRPDVLRPGAQIATLSGFTAHRLVGANAIDRNLAAMCGLYSLDAGDWRDEVIEMCGLSRAQMPVLVDVGARASSPAGASSALEAVFAGNDQTASALANGCRGGDVVLSLGTTLVAYRHAGPMPGPYNAGTCWGPYPGGGFYELAVQDEGGSALDWARRELTPDDDLGTFIERAAVAAHEQRTDVFFYPQRMGADGAWRGQGSREAMALAVLEGIGFSLRRLVVEEMQTPAISSVCATGGGSRSAFSRQLLANVLNCPVRRGQGDALLGAAMMARPTAAPIDSTASDVALPHPEEATRYDRLYHEWRATRLA